MNVVYVIKHSVNNKFYIGFTKNLRQRLTAHNQNKNRSTMRKSGKWELIYAEAYKNEQDARERESRLKHHGSSKHELMKRIERSCLSEGQK